MQKPFKTYDEQIEQLKRKGLTIVDEENAKETLRQIGYYALITGYKDLFKDPVTHNYRVGTTLEDIVALYRFDEQLRELTLHYILQIERHIRSSLSYAFCIKFGDQQAAYLDENNFDGSSNSRQQKIQKLIQGYLKSFVTYPTDYPYLEHYRRTYGNVPLWVLVNALTFGTLSKFYELSDSQVRSAVSREFEGINEKQLVQLLGVLTDYRNLCAHGERLFSHRCATKDIPNLPLHQKLQIPKRGTTYIQGKRDYFALVIAFRYLLPKAGFLEYQERLAETIQKAVRENRQVSEEALLKLMGIPTNWKEIAQYEDI